MATLDYHITFYHHAHLGAVTSIYAHHVLHGRASFEEVPPSEEEMAERFATLAAQDYPILIALNEQGDLLGYAYAGPHKLRSAYRFTVEDSIYVAPDALGKGFGKALLTALISQCEEAGFQQMLAVIGDSENAASIGLHASCGFVHFGTATKVGFKFGQWLDVVYMQRELRPASSSALSPALSTSAS